MTEPTRHPDVERRINEHLEAIDKALSDKGVPLTERRSVTGDVEAQIRDMLAANAGGNPTLADVETILRRLDAPESYAEEAEGAPVEQARSAVGTEWEFHAFRKRLMTVGLVICVIGLPMGIVLRIPYVWVMSTVGIVVGSIKLARMRSRP